MTDRRTPERDERWGHESATATQRRFFSDKPVKTPERYRNFLLSTLFTFGGDQ